MLNLILLGLPGAGKGTQASFITDEYDVPHISTGDMFREAIKNNTQLGLEAKSFMDEGNLVPDSVTNGVVEERLDSDDVKSTGFLLDGYPRTIDQAGFLDNTLSKSDRKLDAVIYLNVDKSILMDRLTGRYICSNCGATYHKLNNNPEVDGVCDRCGGTDFYQRDDDKPETVEKRIEVNSDQTQALLDYYTDKGIVLTINGDTTPEKAFEQIDKALKAL